MENWKRLQNVCNQIAPFASLSRSNTISCHNVAEMQNSDNEELRVVDRPLPVNKMMLGGSGIAGMYAVIPRETAIATLKRALELGIEIFDTAPFYGAGFSEEYFGEILGDLKHVDITTKVGKVIKHIDVCDPNDENAAWDAIDFFKLDGRKQMRVAVHDYSGSGVRRSFEDSILRLKGHKIKCLRLHDAETPEYFYTATQKDAAVDELVKLRQEGHIEEVSLGMNDAAYILKLLRKYPAGTFDNIMLAGCWNLVDQSGYEVLLECQRLGIKVVQAGVFASGLLWGSTHVRYDDAQADDFKKVADWKALCKKYGVSLPAAAVAFAYLPEIVEYVCVGVKKPRYVETNVALCKESVPAQLWSDAKKQGLLPNWVPVPK